MNRGIILILALAGMTSLLNAQEPDSVKYKVLPAEKFIEEFHANGDAVLIDVRYNKDYRKSRIHEAVNIPYPSIKEEYFGGPDAIPIDKSVFIYCYVGMTSRKIAVLFYDHGYRNIFSLEGGFSKWKSKKMPIEKKRIHKTE